MLSGRFTSAIRFAARNVLRYRRRSLFAVLAIASGVIGLILTGGFVKDIFVQLGEWVIHSQTGHLQVSKTGFRERGARRPEQFLISDATALKARIQRYREVKDVMARISFSALLGTGRTELAVAGEGIEPKPEEGLGSHIFIVEGRQLRGDDVASGIVGEGVARSLNLRPGDHVTLLASTVSGAANTLEVKVVGVFRTFSKEYDARAVRIPLRASQELLDTQGANTVVVSLHATDSSWSAAAALRADLRDADLEVHAWQELNDFYQKTVDLYNRQFGVLRLIVLVMIVLGVVNTMNMGIFERLGELGTMRAVGSESRSLFFLLVFEAALLACVGAGVGVVIGTLAGWAISAIGIPMPPPPNSNMSYTAQVRISPEVVLSAGLVGLCATILAAILPASQAVRMPIAEALRKNL